MPAIHLCIGAPRSGTTWLFNNLRERTDIFVPAIKEVRFWYGRRSRADVEASVRKLSQSDLPSAQMEWLGRWNATDEFSAATYRALMSVDGRPSIDISPIYSIMPADEIRRVVDAIPATSKVVYFVRNPLDRFLSQLRLHLYMHGQFRGAASDGTIRALVSRQALLDRSDYEAVADRWSAILGERFRVFDYEGLQRDPALFLSNVCGFLGLDTHDLADLKNATNVYASDTVPGKQSYSPTFSARQRAIVAAAIRPTVDRGYSIVAEPVARSWQGAVAAACQGAGMPDDEEPDSPFHRLMRLTESVGDNCEFGFWQRRRGYEPSSLFRWALTPAPALGEFLRRTTFGSLYRRGNLVRHSPGMVHDTGTGFKFHSKLPEIAGDEEIARSRRPALIEMFEEEREKIVYLRRKFFVQARRKPGLYVIKGRKLSVDDVRTVADGLLALNAGHVILWVGRGPRRTVEPIAGNILSAQMPDFAPYQSANDVDDDAWTRILEGCLEQEPIERLLRSAIR